MDSIDISLAANGPAGEQDFVKIAQTEAIKQIAMTKSNSDDLYYTNRDVSNIV
jgi:hypothetical protein